MNRRYYILDTTAKDYAAIIDALTVEFHRHLPQNNLSIVLSDDGKRALVKMQWGTDVMNIGFGAAKPVGEKDPKAATLESMKLMEATREEHWKIVQELAKPEWSTTRVEPAVVGDKPK